jgi:RNA polymerase sigma factor (sigma-70 family)
MVDGRRNPAYQRWYYCKKYPNAGMRQQLKYGVPSRINGKRNPEHTRLYNQSERGRAAAARRREKRIAEGRPPANSGRKCAYCEVRATGMPVKNGVIIHGPRSKGQSGGKSQRVGMFICRECCPDGRLTPDRAQERIRTHTRIVSGELPEEPLTFARPLRAARDVAAEEYREPVALELLEESLSELDARARLIIRMRADGFSLDEVGTKVGLTRERTRQIQNEAFLKLRKILRKRERELDNPTAQQ